MKPELHPVELLVDLVITEEMDPWDIDIAEIANKFLEEVRQMVRINLRLSGRTLLTSSILLRLKSESLVPKEEDGDEEFFNESYADFEEREDVVSLPMPMRRRAERKTTLFELVEALQRALREELIRKNFPRETRSRRKLIIQVDEEDIKERIIKVYERIQKLAKLYEVIKFSELLSEKTRRGVVELILALLYLDSQRKINIWQKELFGEIFITLN